MLANVNSAALIGVHAQGVEVEVNAAGTGELRIILVGLPDAAVKESEDRVTSAISNSGYKLPDKRTTINLAPGNIKKEGPIYDLPIALGLLVSTNQVDPNKLEDYLIGGELSLSGATRPIKGALAIALLAKKMGKRGVILPNKCAHEAAIVEGIEVIGVDSLDEAARFLDGKEAGVLLPSGIQSIKEKQENTYTCDFSEIKGQKALRRAIEVAVAGGHNLLMIGPPGSGKSMVAKRIPTIMPEPSLDEFLEILSIHSIAGNTLKDDYPLFQRPFRSPHHTISDAGLLGGGSIPGPGEISLAHNGVLFMDELPEFKRSTLEVLRQPLEDSEVTISRSAGQVTLPSSIMLVAAMNPCPCGYLGDKQRECRCSSTQVQRYRNRISGPLLDRIDIHIEAPALSIEELRNADEGESSKNISDRINGARQVQYHRLGHPNDGMNPKQMREHCDISQEQGKILQSAMEQLNLSARAYNRILKVSRTIADLENSEKIQTQHLLEAIQYRTLDRSFFY